MMGTTHLAFGLAVVGIAGHAGLPLETSVIVAAGIGSLLPDIDHPHSKIARYVPILPWIVNLTAGHRGITHSAAALVTISLLAWGLAGWPVAIAMALGYASHLAGDMVTGSIPLAWPKDGKAGIRLWTTGSLLELPIAGLFGLVAYLTLLS
jgi:inner membrane protein